MKKIIAVLLLLFLFTGHGAAAIDLDVDVDDTRGEVEIKGKSSHTGLPVSIKVFDEKRSYYIDQTETDSNGEFEFVFRLDTQKEYEGKIRVGTQTKAFDITTKEQDIIIQPVEQTAYIYIKGYEGVILPKTHVEIWEDDTVLDVLKRVLREHDIDYEIRGGYVAEIDGQAEFDLGPGSGWMFSINGDFPDLGAGSVEVDPGDYIKFLYTEDLGKDIGNVYQEEIFFDHIEELMDKALEAIHESTVEEDDVADALIELTENILAKADDIDEDQGDEVFDTIEDSVEILKKAVLKLETHEYLHDVITSSTNLLETIKLIDEDIEEAAVQETRLDIGKVLYTVLERVGTETIAIDNDHTEGEIAVVSIDSKDFVEKIEEIKVTADTIQNELDIHGIKLNKALYKNVKYEFASAGVNNLHIKLPSKALNSLKNQDIDRVCVKTHLAGFNLKADAFSESTADKEITIITKSLDIDDFPGASNAVELSINADGRPVKLDGPVEVGISCSPTAVSTSHLTVFHLNKTGDLKPLGGVYDEQSRQVKFFTHHFSPFIVKPSLKRFDDLNKFQWAEEHVEGLAGKGIIKGRTQNSFDPDADVTRAEFTALVTRMLQLPLDDRITPFKDVNEQSWYAKAVAAAYSKGIIKGISQNRFNPQGFISRQEMALILSRILKEHGFNPADREVLERFEDRDEIYEWAEDGIALAVREGIIQGGGEGRFYPRQKASRAETAVMLDRVYKLLLGGGSW